jgi:hypothetical protein
MTQRLRRVGVLSMAKMTGALCLIIGAVFAILFGVIFSSLPMGGAGMPGLGRGMGVGMVIVAPLFYGVFGFVFGAFYAWVYNLVAGIAGGLELDLE